MFTLCGGLVAPRIRPGLWVYGHVVLCLCVVYMCVCVCVCRAVIVSKPCTEVEFDVTRCKQTPSSQQDACGAVVVPGVRIVGVFFFLTHPWLGCVLCLCALLCVYVLCCVYVCCCCVRSGCFVCVRACACFESQICTTCFRAMSQRTEQGFGALMHVSQRTEQGFRALMHVSQRTEQGF